MSKRRVRIYNILEVPNNFPYNRVGGKLKIGELLSYGQI